MLSGSSPVSGENNPVPRDVTLTLTKTVRLTQTPAPRFTPTSSELSVFDQIRATEASLFYDCGSSDKRITSDDGAWVAVRCIGMSIGVYKPEDLSRHFTLNNKDIFGNKNEGGYPGDMLWPVHFSTDGKTFFFASHLNGDGGCPVYGMNYGLFKLDLNTGQISEQVSPVKHVLYNFAFSTKDDYLAYIGVGNGHSVLHVIELGNNAVRDIPLDTTYSDAGSILWSPDDAQLIFSTTTGEDCYERNYSVVSLDLKDFNQKVIVQGSAKMLIPVRWIDTEHILVLTGFDFDPTYTILNITTGELDPESHPEAIPL